MGRKRASTHWRTSSRSTAVVGREQVVEVVEISSFEGGHGFQETRGSLA